MLNQTTWIAALALGCASASATDVLQLKNEAAITGKILTEKPDQIAVDIGYTVLVIPRSYVLSITAGQPGIDTENLLSKAVKTITGSTAGETSVQKPSPTPLHPGLFRASNSAANDRTVRELVELIGEAVVQIRTPSGLGSGFIIHEDGYLITNYHVIESETQIGAEVYHQRDGQLERRSYRQVRIVAMNKFADLALLKIDDKDAPKFAAVPLGNSDELGVGERVFAIGSPLGLERTVTEGIVSTKTRPLQGDLYLQTTTQINPGNSGGPLFNLRGEVVGVTNMKITFGEGLGFAIPIDAVKSFLAHRDAYAYDSDNPSSPYRYLEPPSRVSKLLPEQ